MRAPHPLLIIALIIGIAIVFVLYFELIIEPKADVFCKDKEFTEGEANNLYEYQCHDIDSDGKIGEWVRYKI